MAFEEFSTYLKGKDFDKLVHEAKAESENRLLGQGIAYIALFISELMMQAVTSTSTYKQPQEEKVDLH